MKRSPVEPRLFEEVARFCRSSTPVEELSETSDLVDVVKQFYLQFFKNEVKREIVAIDATTNKHSVRIRLELTKDKEGTWKPLLVWFEEFCELFPDLQAARYVPSEEVARRFLVDYSLSFSTARWRGRRRRGFRLSARRREPHAPHMRGGRASSPDG
jgi:hypothetical protein